MGPAAVQTPGSAETALIAQISTNKTRATQVRKSVFDRWVIRTPFSSYEGRDPVRLLYFQCPHLRFRGRPRINVKCVPRFVISLATLWSESRLLLYGFARRSVQILSYTIKDTIHESARVRATVRFRQLDGLVNRDHRGDIVAVEHF